MERCALLVFALLCCFGSTQVLSQSISGPGCICTREFAPVCGSDGNNYSNPCVAQCAGVTEACDGNCPCEKSPPPPPGEEPQALCSCAPSEDLVCTTTQETYGNACLAGCDGKKVECSNACPCWPSLPSEEPCYGTAVCCSLCFNSGSEGAPQLTLPTARASRCARLGLSCGR